MQVWLYGDENYGLPVYMNVSISDRGNGTAVVASLEKIRNMCERVVMISPDPKSREIPVV